MQKIDKETGKDVGMIKNMSPGNIKSNYLLYIGAGAVAAGGIISMCRAMPLIMARSFPAFAICEPARREGARLPSGPIATCP